MSEKIPWQQVKKHQQVGDCWLVIESRVFNVSEYMKRHPGGRWILLENTGKDATPAFHHTIHSQIAREIMMELYIGEIQTSLPQPQPQKQPFPQITPYSQQKPSQQS